MKKPIKLLVVFFFLTAIIIPLAAQQGTVSGTYVLLYQGVELSITYSGSNFSLFQDGAAAGTGTFRVSGNSIFHNNNTTASFTIIDANSIRDTDGDIWRKWLSGTYTWGAQWRITFTGNNFVYIAGTNESRGTYTMSGNDLTLNYSDGRVRRWVIVNDTTLRDSDGDTWNKLSLSGTYRYSSNLYITFSGDNFTYYVGDTVFTGSYAIAGTVLTLNFSNGITHRWTVVNDNLLRDPDNDDFRK